MKKSFRIIALGLLMMIPFMTKAQDKLKVNGKIDFASDYIWRGAYQNSGFSVQPTLGLAYKNFSLSAWGSQSLTKADGAQEFDINLSYSFNRFCLTLTDYWWNGITNPYGDYKNDHHFEASLMYTFGEKCPLTLGWATMFAGSDDNDEGERAYSTYISASYVFNCPAEISLTPAVGFTPWKGMYYAEKAGFTDISLKASKSIKLGERFSLPIFVQAIASPFFDKTYLIAGWCIEF